MEENNRESRSKITLLVQKTVQTISSSLDSCKHSNRSVIVQLLIKHRCVMIGRFNNRIYFIPPWEISAIDPRCSLRYVEVEILWWKGENLWSAYVREKNASYRLSLPFPSLLPPPLRCVLIWHDRYARETWNTWTPRVNVFVAQSRHR